MEIENAVSGVAGVVESEPGISALGLAALRRHVGSSKMGVLATMLLQGAGTLSALYAAWVYLRISDLGHQYGWGAIPPTEFPIPPETIGSTFDILGWIEIGGFVGGGIAFLYAMSQIRWGLEALIGKASFHYTWGWTLGSVIIPFVSLYRPWVGFAEVRRAATGIASRQQISSAWKSDSFNVQTFVLGAVYIAGGGAIRLVNKATATAAATSDFTLSTVDEIEHLLMTDFAVRLVIFGVMLWYLLTTMSAARRVVTLAETTAPFS